MKQLENNNMNYICKECQTEYISANGTPSGIKWSDGHKCKPVKISEKQLNIFRKLIGNIKINKRLMQKD